MAAKKKGTLEQWVATLNNEPNPDHIRKNDDGSLYIPISITQMLLDEIFLGRWDFEMKTVTYGRKWARGNGIMTVSNPINNYLTVRSGDAGILLTGNVRTDSPRLEAMVLLSCARKFGKIFGRDLNRNKDDAPLPVVKADEKLPENEEKRRLTILIEQSTTIEELKTFELVAKQYKVTPVYTKQLKKLQNGSSTTN